MQRAVPNLTTRWELTDEQLAVLPGDISVQARHITYHWNGRRVDMIKDHDAGQAVPGYSLPVF
jgi:hypothetical protein